MSGHKIANKFRGIEIESTHQYDLVLFSYIRHSKYLCKLEILRNIVLVSRE